MTSQSEIQHLLLKKERIEDEIKALSSVLESQQSVGMREKLVDDEGFPRADIDIYSVRHARQKIICLQNDHKELMKDIETELHRIHAEARKTGNVGPTAMDVSDSDNSKSKTDFSKVFARVDRIDSDSPAMEAGLEVNDLMTQFGSVTKKNFENLQTIGNVVQHSKDKSLSVTVIRKGEIIHLALTPKAWSGRGLLGCNILSVK